MGIIKKAINKITGADKSTQQVYEDSMKKRQKAFDKVLKEKESRQKMQGQCAAVLDECRETFERTINNARAQAKQMQKDGLDTSTEEARIREAAIGIMVVKEAKYKLKSISSESDLNMAMNRLGMALRQINRLDNSAAAISPSTEKIVEEWCPGVITELSDLSATDLEVPEALRQRVDERVVFDLLNGGSYDVVMMQANHRAMSGASAAPAKKAPAPKAKAAPTAVSSDAIVQELLQKAKSNNANRNEEPVDLSSYTDQI